MKVNIVALVLLVTLMVIFAVLFPSHGTGARIEGYYPIERGEHVTCVVSDRYMEAKNIWRSLLTCEASK